MKKERGYCFGGITIDDMNPDNIALKNDFNHNLHLMFITLAPLLGNYLENPKILKAMCSHKQCIKDGKDSFIDKKFSSGEACTVTYDNYNKENIFDILKLCLDKINENYSFALSDTYFTVFKSSKKEIGEFVDDRFRVIFS